MIKKYISYFIRYILVLLILAIYIVEPMNAKAAIKSDTTLADLKQELSDLQAKKKKTETEKAMSQAEKNKKNQEIANSYNEIEDAKQKVNEAKIKIEETNKKIAEVETQSKELMKYYQQISDNNTYLEFITSSSSMTELIMRIDAVDKLVEYNQDKLKELEELIKQNEQLQVDMIKYQEEQNNKINEYEQRIKEINSNLISLADISMDIDTEIKTQQALIKMYEDMGCKNSDILAVCSSTANNSGWLKPVEKGVITSLFGWRNVSGQSSNHSGIDIGVAEGTTVYSATNGTVVSIVNRSSCGGNQIYIQSLVNGQKYTVQYAHLLSINVKVGDKVTNQTVIGKSGGYSTSRAHGGYDSCTTGAHLHFGVSNTYYTSWSAYVAHLINPPGFPGKGAWFYSRTQWFK